MRRPAAGAIVRSFAGKRRHAVLSWTGNNRCKSVSETAGAATETAGFVECIEVASFAFVHQLGAGTLLEVKCLFAIDSITAVYGDCGCKGDASGASIPLFLNFSAMDRPPKAPARRITLGYRVNSELIFPN
jgi:Na+/serine symporter